MRALPALDARGCIVRETPTPDLRIRAEVSLDEECRAHGCIRSNRALFCLSRLFSNDVPGEYLALPSGIEKRLFHINPFHGVWLIETIADVFHVLLEQCFRTVASGGDHRIIGVRAI